LGKDFPEAESKGYDSKTMTRKAKAWEEILTRFNSRIPNGIKRDFNQLQGCRRRLNLQSKKKWLTSSGSKKNDGGKASASPSEVSKLVADVLPASVNPLDKKFDDDDDDGGEELDLKRDKYEREVITCEVEPSLLADLEAIGKKGVEKVATNSNQLFYEVTDRVLPKAKTQSKGFVVTLFL